MRAEPVVLQRPGRATVQRAVQAGESRDVDPPRRDRAHAGAAEFDEHFEGLRQSAAKDQRVLRMIASINEEGKAQTVLEDIKDDPFIIDSFEKKNGKETPPQLFDLTRI